MTDRRFRPLTEREIRQIAAAYRSGRTIRWCARTHHVGVLKVWEALERSGVPRRSLTPSGGTHDAPPATKGDTNAQL